MRVGIVNYGRGNLDSVERAVSECGAIPVTTCDPDELRDVDALILPGVGSFGDAMDNLTQRGLHEILEELVLTQGVPLLGICLGMQILFTWGEEGGGQLGLGWIGGNVLRLSPRIIQERIPHIGWNEVNPVFQDKLFENIEAGKDFYFVHSYHCVPDDPDQIVAQTPYCGCFVSAIRKGCITGVQFHPEKSQRPGFQVLKNFLSRS